MSREARRVHKWFKGEIGKVWWGYLLPAIPCQDCAGAGADCPTCEGEGEVSPKVSLPGFAVDELPSYFRLDYYQERYGWQMWETTSEGSPMSPVFETAEELAHWLADTGASAFGDSTASYDQWLATCYRGGAPSAVLDSNGFRSGVEALASDSPSPIGESGMEAEG